MITPEAIAITFFIAPPICVPIISLLKYVLNFLLEIILDTSFKILLDSEDKTLAVGSPFITSAAKLGPESIAKSFFGNSSFRT